MVLVFWGITPLQSGIFVASTITRTDTISVWASNASSTSATKTAPSSITYLYSVFGISWLNETLPPFMTRDYALAPFGMTDVEEAKNEERWSAATQLYSLDLDCDVAITEDVDSIDGFRYDDPQMMRFYSGRGCRTRLEKRDISDTAGYLAFFAGYHANEYAHYYISSDCPQNSSHVAFIVWARTRRQDTDKVGDSAALFCEAKYYYQNVNASVSAMSGKVLGVSNLGPKMPLPEDLFNSTSFEMELTSGSQVTREREDIPSGIMPDPNHRLQDMDIILPTNIYTIGYAIAAEKRPPADYLNPETLRHSYQSAYRLLFARSMTDLLKSRAVKTAGQSGVRSYKTGAVKLVPIFAYLVEGLLATTATLAAGLLYINAKRPRKLTGDPAAITTTMSLVAESHELPDYFSGLESLGQKQFEQSLQSKKFRLARSVQSQGYSLEVTETQKLQERKPNRFRWNNLFKRKTACVRTAKTYDPVKAIRPFELGTPAAILFITVLIFLLSFIATLQIRILDLDGMLSIKSRWPLID